MKALKILIYIVAAAIILSILIVVGLMMLLTTSWAQSKLINVINENIPGKVSAQTIQLSLFGNQHIEGLELKGKDGDFILKVGQIEVDSPLFKLISTPDFGGKAEVKNLQAMLKLTEKGTFNVNDALGFPSPEINSQATFPPISINNVNAHIKFDGFFSKMEISASGNTEQGTEQGRFEVTSEGGATSKLKFKATHFPTAILDQLIALNHPDYAGFGLLAIGESSDFTIGFSGDSRLSNFDGSIRSPLIATTFSGEMTADQIRFNTPVNVNLTVTPQLYQKVAQHYLPERFSQQEVLLKLAKPVPVAVQFPLLTLDLNNLKAGSDFIKRWNAKNVTLVDQSGAKKVTLSEFSGEVVSKPNSKTLTWSLQANGLGDGVVKLTGVLPSLSANAIYTLTDLDFQARIEGEGVPTFLTTRLAGFDPKIGRAVEAMFGPRVEIKGDIALNHLTGPIKFSLQGDNGSVDLDGRASRGTLYLNRPLAAKSKVTPQFGKDVFGLVLPILNSALSSDSPCTLTISDKGFAFPLSPYDFKLIKFDQGILSLGKISFSSQGELAALLSLLDIPTQDQLLVWFTSIYFSLQQEMLKVERFDMLAANTYPLAMWGNVDFQNEYVNLQIGLTAKALAKALGISGYDSKGMLEIPLKGPISNPKIDRSKVSAQVAKIALQAQIPGGTLIGDILGIASGILGGDTKPPAPTTQPLPWSLNEDNNNQDSNGKNKDVIDQVQKGVNSLLKSLIPK